MRRTTSPHATPAPTGSAVRRPLPARRRLLMNASPVDRLATILATPGTRRRVTRVLATTPLVAALAALLSAAREAAAADDAHGSSHRRKPRHDSGEDKDNRTGRRKGKGKGRGKRSPGSPMAASSTST